MLAIPAQCPLCAKSGQNVAVPRMSAKCHKQTWRDFKANSAWCQKTDLSRTYAGSGGMQARQQDAIFGNVFYRANLFYILQDRR
jgi:hypothetical protein